MNRGCSIGVFFPLRVNRAVVAADVRRLKLLGPNEIRASLRRLLQFTIPVRGRAGVEAQTRNQKESCRVFTSAGAKETDGYER
jgi:hypothetical protein